MIRTTRNPILGSASFWTQDLSILGFKTKTLSELVSDMFKNGEQGFFYDPSSLTYGTYGVDQTSIGVPVTVGVADAAEYDSSLHTGHVYRADQYNQSIVNFDVDNTKSHELVIENTGSTTIAVNADLAMGTVLFTVAAGQRVTRIISPVQVIVITSANDVSTAYFKIHSLKEFTGQYIMYQDSAGTTPVTAVGQPVGLMLDKSKGLALGNELVINGDFGTSTTGWSENNATIEVQSGKLKVTATITGDSRAQQIVTGLTAGRFYTVKGNFQPSLACRVRANNAVANTAYSSGNSYQSFMLVFLATSSSANIALELASTTAWMSQGSFAYFDNISVKELAGNHAYQSTSASRPLLQRNATTGAYYLAFDGRDDFLVTSSINFTATDKISLFAGVRKLSGATQGLVAELSTNISTYNGTFNMLAPAGPETANRYRFTVKGTLLTTKFTSTTSEVGGAAVMRGVADVSNGKAGFYLNGIMQGSDASNLGTGNYGNYPIYIGRRGGTTFPFNGHLYSLIGIARLSTDAETTNLEKAIAKNVGVTI